MQKIFIYGPPGSGKSSVGKILANNLAYRFIDVDSEIESQKGTSIKNIVNNEGLAFFRELELSTIKSLCESRDTMVIALGGGALLQEENRQIVDSSGRVIFLDSDYPSLIARLGNDKSQRPLLSGDLEKKLADLMNERKIHYGSFKLRIATNHKNDHSDKSPEAIAWEIQQSLGYYRVGGMGADYDVVVENGGIIELGRMLIDRGLRGPIAVVTDKNIAPIYADIVKSTLISHGFETKIILITPGEENKTLSTINHLWQNFLGANLDRKSTIVALGGGVVGDLAGFAASTFMRGCNWVSVPTTLLSMVDASLGGKTGFDLPEGKNLIGSFYPPRFVLADPTVLSTLPVEEIRSGLAEVVKHGVVGDSALFELCNTSYELIEPKLSTIIRRAIGVKVNIINHDPYEKGIRATLNFGHTVGHALEQASNYRLRHGEAVSIGMVYEARLAERLGIAEKGLKSKIEQELIGLNLPVKIPSNISKSDIVNTMRFDKKKENSIIYFALPVSIGNVQANIAVTELDSVL